MGHVIDEVVLDFRQFFRTEHENQGNDKRDKKNQREHHRGNDEAHRRKDVTVHIREMNAHHTFLILRIIIEQDL